MSDGYELIIFDLDGTLLDTSPGIFNSVRYAEQQMGFVPIPDFRLREFVGPPPKQKYMEIYHLDEETAQKAVMKHREYGKSHAVYEASLYPDMEKVLKYLKQHRYKLAVATLKSQKIAEKVLEVFNISAYFDAIVGMDPKETFTKQITIDRAIELTDTNRFVLMIGDSWYDYQGATEANVDFIGAMYGFGFHSSDDIPTDWRGYIDRPIELLEYV